MLNWDNLEQCHREHYQDLLREVEHARLARRALAGRDPERPLFCRMLLWLGHRLVVWGQWLQQRFAAERPLGSVPVIGRSQ